MVSYLNFIKLPLSRKRTDTNYLLIDLITTTLTKYKDSYGQNLFYTKGLKLGMYGSNYVWMIPGYFSDDWMTVAIEGGLCSYDELKIATEGYIAVTYSFYGTGDDIGLCGKVRQ